MNIESVALWSALPLPALLIDQRDQVIELNSAAETFFNQSNKAMVGAPLDARLTFDAPIAAALKRTRVGHSTVSIRDISVGSAFREPIACQVLISEFDGSDGTLLLLLVPQDGVTSHSQGRIARSAIGMAEMLVHEIKNPLAGISGAAQLLSMSIADEDRELTSMIVSETKRVTRLLDQVEQFGNLLPPNLKAVNLHDVLDRARQSALLGFASDVEIHEDYDPSLPLALADPDQLLQVFLNLLKNAAHALANVEGGAITIRTHFDGALRVRDAKGKLNYVPLQVDIIDNGPGLPPEMGDAAFDPFVSGRENGTGLGLALVMKIITDHSGWVSVHSVPGRTSFSVSLPLAPADVRAEQTKITETSGD